MGNTFHSMQRVDEESDGTLGSSWISCDGSEGCTGSLYWKNDGLLNYGTPSTVNSLD